MRRSDRSERARDDVIETERRGVDVDAARLAASLVRLLAMWDGTA